MADFFILFKYHTKNDAVVQSFKAAEEIEDRVINGRPIEKGMEIRVTLDRGRNRRDMLIGATSFPIVSERLKDLLMEHAATEFLQFLPLTIASPKMDDRYYLLNILNNLKCFDWDKSDYSEFPDFIKKELPHLTDMPDHIKKLVLRETVIGTRDIFRMYEKPADVFISGRLKGIMEQEGISGCRYAKLEEYGGLLYLGEG